MPTAMLKHSTRGRCSPKSKRWRAARIELARPTPTEPSAAAQTGLSPRELEVLALVADGLTNREIGSTLFISEKTVRVHVSRILAKLGAANRTQAATLAQHLGIRPVGASPERSPRANTTRG
jgi:DNA-binding NarL/FixJ family response regulator